jgi:hypothetical protein
VRIDETFTMDVFLPAIVVGRSATLADRQLRDSLGPPPPWLFWWQHQYGGYSCSQAGLTGAMLPLHAFAADDAKRIVVSGLCALNEDSDRGPQMGRFPELSGLHLTAGRPYAEGQCDALYTFVRRGFDLPRIVGGAEALVELAVDDLLAAFRGWPMLGRGSSELGLGNQAFDSVRLDELGARLTDPPRSQPVVSAYLVWANSD